MRRSPLTLLALASSSCSSGAPHVVARPLSSASISAPSAPVAAPLSCEPGLAEREGRCVRIAPRLAIGPFQVCAALVDGRVFCWGRNDGGQFLPWIPVGTYSPTPREIEGLTDAVDVAASMFDACAIRRDGTAVCSGGFAGGPKPVVGVENAIRIAGGREFFCALASDGRVPCWGAAFEMPNVDGATDNRKAAFLHGVDDALDLVVTESKTCVLRGDRRVTCFANGGAKTSSDVDGLPSIERLVASDASSGEHLCGVGADDTLACWGRADLEPVRDERGGATHTPTIRKFDLPHGARSVALGGRFACALDGGALRCTRADLGEGVEPAKTFAAPIAADMPGFARTGGEAPVALTASYRSLCASYASGNVRCIGQNDSGEIGTGEGGTRFEPKVVAGIVNATRVVVSTSGSCVATTDGVWCWGFHATDVTDENRDAMGPRKLVAPGNAAWFGREEFSASAPIAIDTGGRLWALPDDSYGKTLETMVPVAGLPPISSITGITRYLPGSEVDYATTPDGGVLAVTRKLDRGSPTPNLELVSMPLQGLGPVRQVVTRNQTACAVRRNGTVACWRIASPFAVNGKKAPPEGTRPKLLEIRALSHAEQLTAAMRWCARRTDGTVACFDLNDSEDGKPLALVRPPNDQTAFAGTVEIDGVTDLGALTRAGTCLYQGPQYQNDQFAPAELPCEDVTSYSVADGGCEVKKSGEVACWGNNRGGRVGSGDRTFVLRPEDAHLPAAMAESGGRATSSP